MCTKPGFYPNWWIRCRIWPTTSEISLLIWLKNFDLDITKKASSFAFRHILCVLLTNSWKEVRNKIWRREAETSSFCPVRSDFLHMIARLILRQKATLNQLKLDRFCIFWANAAINSYNSSLFIVILIDRWFIYGLYLNLNAKRGTYPRSTPNQLGWWWRTATN